MKTSILLAVVLLFNIGTITSQTNSAVEKAVEKVDQAQTLEDWKQCRNQFERLAVMEADNWLPAYYMIYTDIKLSFWSENGTEKERYLEEAKNYLEKIKKMKLTDNKIRSEINTIRGYIYYALMALNPSVNGPRYTGLVIDCYSDALKLNPENPRAILLNAYFQKSLAAFMNSNYNTFEDDLKKAYILLEKEDKHNAFPHWGKNEFPTD